MSDASRHSGSQPVRLGRRGAPTTARHTRFTVLICRGCCCGTTRKHPGVDHDAQVEALTAAAQAGGGRARVVDCVDQCSWSNVVVVRRPGTGQAAEWIGGLLDPDDTGRLARWLGRGAPAGQPPTFTRATSFVRPQTPEA